MAIHMYQYSACLEEETRMSNKSLRFFLNGRISSTGMFSNVADLPCGQTKVSLRITVEPKPYCICIDQGRDRAV